MIWYATDIEGYIYTLGDYGDVVAAAEAAIDYIDLEVVDVWRDREGERELELERWKM
jgi:hypothetical protein